MQAFHILNNFGSFRQNLDNDERKQETCCIIFQFCQFSEALNFNTFFKQGIFRKISQNQKF